MKIRYPPLEFEAKDFPQAVVGDGQRDSGGDKLPLVVNRLEELQRVLARHGALFVKGAKMYLSPLHNYYRHILAVALGNLYVPAILTE